MDNGWELIASSLTLLAESRALAKSVVLVSYLVPATLAGAVIGVPRSPNLVLGPKISPQEGHHGRLPLTSPMLLGSKCGPAGLEKRFAKRHATLGSPMRELLVLQAEVYKLA